MEYEQVLSFFRVTNAEKKGMALLLTALYQAAVRTQIKPNETSKVTWVRRGNTWSPKRSWKGIY